MQLQRLTGLERQKILDELAEMLKLIERLQAILASDKLLLRDHRQRAAPVGEKYGDDRRTEILPEEGEFRIEDLIAEEDVAITVTHTGYIKRTAITTYRNQRRGGKGRIGMRTREEDFVSHLFVASTHAYILIFTDRGRAYWLKVHEIPDVGPTAAARPSPTWCRCRKANDRRAAGGARVRGRTSSSSWAPRGRREEDRALGVRNPRAGGIIAMASRRATR